MDTPDTVVGALRLLREQGYDIRTYKGLPELLLELENGRVDVIINDSIAAILAMKERGYDFVALPDLETDAIGAGIAITSGVTMNDTGSSGAIGASPASASRWFKIAPQLDAAGDQITGRGPSTASCASVQPSARRVVAPPDALA